MRAFLGSDLGDVLSPANSGCEPRLRRGSIGFPSCGLRRSRCSTGFAIDAEGVGYVFRTITASFAAIFIGPRRPPEIFTDQVAVAPVSRSQEVALYVPSAK